MAFESRYWKRQAKGDINTVLKRTNVNVSRLEGDDLDKVFSEVEIKLFTIAYSLRKLMDTNKLPDKTGGLKIGLLAFPRNEKSCLLFSYHGAEHIRKERSIGRSFRIHFL